MYQQTSKNEVKPPKLSLPNKKNMEEKNEGKLMKANDFEIQIPILKRRRQYENWRQSLEDYLDTKQLYLLLFFTKCIFAHIDVLIKKLKIRSLKVSHEAKLEKKT